MFQLVEELVSSGQGTLTGTIAWELSRKGTIIAGIPMGIQKESGAKPMIQADLGSTVMFRYVLGTTMCARILTQGVLWVSISGCHWVPPTLER